MEIKRNVNFWQRINMVLRKMLLLLILFFCVPSVGRGEKYQDGKFDLLVAISGDETENTALIDKIKTEFEEASKYLWNATSQQHRFGTVTILVPDKWAHKPEYSPGEGETEDQADILVGSNISGAYASDRIYVNPSYMQGKGRVEIHEFGHRYYTLGDEYCDYVYKNGQWYQSFKDANGKWRKCTEKVTFTTNVDEATGGNYQITSASTPADNHASIMWDQWLDGITEFCNSSNHTSLHNTHQDRINGNKSCWETMEGKYGLKASGGTTVTYQAVQFEVKQAVAIANIVLVIDRSGSMSDYGKIGSAKTAAKQFIDLTKDDMVGVVSYSSSATVNAHLVKIIDDTQRIPLKNAVDGMYASGNTSVGDGLLKAMGDLDAYAVQGGVKAIVLLTDGLENTAPYVSSVLPSIIAKKIVVYTVGLGSDADGSLLSNIASQTGGEYYFSPSAGQLADIYKSIKSKVGTKDRTVKSSSSPVPAQDSTSESFVIDSSIDFVSFAMTASYGWGVILTLVDPDGILIDSAYAQVDTNIEYTHEQTYQIYRVKAPKAGEWTMKVKNTGSSTQEVSFFVSGKSYIGLTAMTDTSAYFYPAPIRITATPKGKQPIINANMIATVIRPDSSEVVFELNDNGINGDLTPLDGIYGGYFTQYSGNGYYYIKVNVNNDDLQAREGPGFTDSPLPNVDYRKPSQGVLIGGNFSREISLPLVSIYGYTTTDEIPPGRIHTLEVDATGANWIRLSWFAPGGDMYTGSATKYDLRYATFEISDSTWDSATQVTVGFAPHSAGFQESLAVMGLPPNTLYFAIKSFDQANNVSELSNVVSASPARGAESFEKSLYNFPNPFSPEKDENTTIRFVLKEAGKVTIKIYDVSGDLVWSKEVTGTLGENLVEWDGKNDKNKIVANGVYFLRVEAEGKSAVHKIAVLR
jgi:Mg-chelatase subunit ChlD